MSLQKTPSSNGKVLIIESKSVKNNLFKLSLVIEGQQTCPVCLEPTLMG